MSTVLRLPRILLVLVPLLLLASAITVAVIVFLSPGPDEEATYGKLIAGRVGEFQIGEPRWFSEQRFWLIRLGEKDFVALYSRDPGDGCTLPWRADFEFMDARGWFRNPCHASTYDLVGRCFYGPCPRGMDRFPVSANGGKVIVTVKTLDPDRGLPRDPNATPVTQSTLESRR